MKKLLVVVFVMFCLSCAAHAQSPSGIIDSARYINWSTSGVVGGIPTITTPCPTASVTAANTLAEIRSAISSGSNCVVTFAAGTYNLAGAIQISNNGVVVRGAGPSTILNFTTHTGSSWPWASSGMFQIMSATSAYTGDSAPGVGGIAAGTITNFTGTDGTFNVFTKGATVFNVASSSGLTAGDMLVCWQPNDADVDAPASTFFLNSKIGAVGAIAWQGSHDSYGAGLEHRSLVVSVNSSTSVTVADGIPFPTGIWKTSLAPKCGWLTAAKLVKNVGIENMTIQTTNSTTTDICMICALGTYNLWIKGVVIKPRFSCFHGDACGGTHYADFGVEIKDSIHASVVNNWFDKMIGGGVNTTTSYCAVFPMTQWFRLENNIFNNCESPLEVIVGSVGGAYLYNYENYVGDDTQEAGMQAHDLNGSFNLIEGNSFLKYYADVMHGSGSFETLFRNHIQNGGIDLWSYHRWYNIVGNAIGCNSHYETLPTDGTTYNRFSISCFRLGFSQQYGTAEGYTSGATSCLAPALSTDAVGNPSCVATDTGVKTSMFRWANYDPVNATTRFVSGEVPTSGTQFTNAEPASHALPASFIYSVSPSWWPTGVSWPIIGSDVTGGTYVSGHAKKTPAQLCFEAAGGTSGAYSSTVWTSFSPSTCYDGGGAGQSGGGGSAIGGGSRGLHGR